MSETKQKKDNRFRNWTFLVYPESVIENWIDVINDLHIQWAYSPLHDKDTNPTGENKKPHYHVLLSFEGKKSYDQILEITQSVNGTVPQKVESLRGLTRYFAHLDNPEKYQYCMEDIRCYGGFNVNDALKPTSSEELVLLKEIFSYISGNSILEYSDFIDKCIADSLEDWLYVATKLNTIAIKSYIQSRFNKVRFALDRRAHELKIAEDALLEKEATLHEASKN